MYADRQIFTRFCFCLPLRYGLFLLGCLKLALLLFTIFDNAIVFRQPIFTFAFTAVIIAIIFAIILIVAAYTKNTTLFKVCFIYAILEATVLVSVITVLVGEHMYSVVTVLLGINMRSRPVGFYNFGTELGRPLGAFTSALLFNFYTVLLTRSELMILNSKNLSIDLVNKEKESPCNMKNVCETV